MTDLQTNNPNALLTEAQNCVERAKYCLKARNWDNLGGRQSAVEEGLRMSQNALKIYTELNSQGALPDKLRIFKPFVLLCKEMNSLGIHDGALEICQRIESLMVDIEPTSSEANLLLWVDLYIGKTIACEKKGTTAEADAAFETCKSILQTKTGAKDFWSRTSLDGEYHQIADTLLASHLYEKSIIMYSLWFEQIKQSVLCSWQNAISFRDWASACEKTGDYAKAAEAYDWARTVFSELEAEQQWVYGNNGEYREDIDSMTAKRDACLAKSTAES